MVPVDIISASLDGDHGETSHEAEYQIQGAERGSYETEKDKTGPGREPREIRPA